MARRLGLVALLLVLAVPAAASSASKPTTSVKVLDCDVEDAAATFESVLRVPAGSDLAVRFVLESRAPGERWATVRAPGFSRWVRARSGKTRFVYDRTVTGLAAPSDYRVTVSFRWRDADGAAGSAKRRSAVCEQPDPRPDLRPVALEPTGSGWVLTVANAGGEASPATVVSLRVGNAETRRPVAAIEPGEEVDAVFDPVSCKAGQTLTATVDPDDDVDESDESGNALSVPCPAS